MREWGCSSQGDSELRKEGSFKIASNPEKKEMRLGLKITIGFGNHKIADVIFVMNDVHSVRRGERLSHEHSLLHKGAVLSKTSKLGISHEVVL